MDLNVSENRYFCQDFLVEIPLISMSIRQSIAQKLLESVILDNGRIPLYHLKSPIGYRFTIANSPEAIAKRLVNKIEESDRPRLAVTVRVLASGWIDFYLSDRALATWLQQLPQFLSPIARVGVAEEIADRVSMSQYAHARCCSLLRLANREAFIKLDDLVFNQPVWQWLDRDRFQLVSLAEQALMSQILATTDELDRDGTVNWTKLVNRLSEPVLECDRHCRIWGEVRQKTPEIALTRLSLIAIAQFLLRYLLQEKLAVWAPIEL
jgi:hypothetical protein